MKRIICCALILVLALSVAACGASAPDLGEVKDELKSLIEASYEINEIFFGEGLETYARGGEYDKEHLLYSENDEEGTSEEGQYLFTSAALGAKLSRVHCLIGHYFLPPRSLSLKTHFC